MVLKIPDPSDETKEIEVYTATEVQERETAARATVEGEYKPKLEEATTKLTEAQKRASDRAGEFSNLRTLTEEQKAKLSDVERALVEANESRAKESEQRHEAEVNSAIRARIGTNDKAFEKAKEMWGLVSLAEGTPEQIEQKVLAVIGAVGTTQPDLLAGISGLSGSFVPPAPKEDGKTFAETERGKAIANDLGLKL